jgi:hypothetical protein
VDSNDASIRTNPGGEEVAVIVTRTLESEGQSFELSIETNSVDTHTTFPVKSVQR